MFSSHSIRTNEMHCQSIYPNELSQLIPEDPSILIDNTNRWEELPDELTGHLLSDCSFTTLCMGALVSKKFKEIIENSDTGSRILKKYGLVVKQIISNSNIDGVIKYENWMKVYFKNRYIKHINVLDVSCSMQNPCNSDNFSVKWVDVAMMDIEKTQEKNKLAIKKNGVTNIAFNNVIYIKKTPINKSVTFFKNHCYRGNSTNLTKLFKVILCLHKESQAEYQKKLSLKNQIEKKVKNFKLAPAIVNPMLKVTIWCNFKGFLLVEKLFPITEKYNIEFKFIQVGKPSKCSNQLLNDLTNRFISINEGDKKRIENVRIEERKKSKFSCNHETNVHGYHTRNSDEAPLKRKRDDEEMKRPIRLVHSFENLNIERLVPSAKRFKKE